jgi:hypothetical protein
MYNQTIAVGFGCPHPAIGLQNSLICPVEHPKRTTKQKMIQQEAKQKTGTMCIIDQYIIVCQY